MDADGEVVKDEDGREIKVRVDKGPPKITPEQAVKQDKSDEISRVKTDDGEIITMRPQMVADTLSK